MTSTRTSTHRPWTADPDRWPDVAVAAGSPARAAVARAVFGTAVARLPVRVRLADGGADSRGLHGGGGPAAPVMHIHRPREFFRRFGASGLIGFGESYMAGDWDSTDLTALLTVFAAHAAELVPPWLQRLRRLAVRRQPPDDLQTIAGARRNIGRHYDLSNDLFALFLDETMTYSCALFPERDGVPAAADLAEAQHRKIDRLLDRAGVGPGCRVLEIGTGWGELAIRAARRGATVRTITISARAAGARRPPGRRGRAGRPGQRGTARLPRRRRPVRRDLLGRDARGGRRALLGRLLRGPRRAPGPGRADRAADDHDGARPDAGHPAHLHLDPEVRLPRRAAPVRHRDR